MEIVKNMNKHFIGILFALCTGISWGVVSPLGRALALRGVDMATVIVLRAFLVTICCGTYLAWCDRASLKKTVQEQGLLFIYGILSVVCTYTGFLYSLKYLTVSAALIIHYTFPLVTLIGGIFITRERPTFAQIVSAFLILLGVWVGMFFGKGGAQNIALPGILWGLVAVMGLAGQSLLGRKIAKEGRITQGSLIFYSHLWGGLCMVLAKHLSAGWHDIALLSHSDWGSIFLLTAIGSLLAYAAYYTALKYISATAASLVCTVEIVTGISLAAALSKEMPTTNEIWGSAIIILAIFLAALPPDLFQRRPRHSVRDNA